MPRRRPILPWRVMSLYVVAHFTVNGIVPKRGFRRGLGLGVCRSPSILTRSASEDGRKSLQHKGKTTRWRFGLMWGLPAVKDSNCQPADRGLWDDPQLTVGSDRLALASAFPLWLASVRPAGLIEPGYNPLVISESGPLRSDTPAASRGHSARLPLRSTTSTRN